MRNSKQRRYGMCQVKLKKFLSNCFFFSFVGLFVITSHKDGSVDAHLQYVTRRDSIHLCQTRKYRTLRWHGRKNRGRWLGVAKTSKRWPRSCMWGIVFSFWLVLKDFLRGYYTQKLRWFPCYKSQMLLLLYFKIFFCFFSASIYLIVQRLRLTWTARQEKKWS